MPGAGPAAGTSNYQAGHSSGFPLEAGIEIRVVAGVARQEAGNAALLYYRAFSPEWWGTIQRQKDLYEKLDKWEQMPLSDLRKELPKGDLAWVLDSAMLGEVDWPPERNTAIGT